MMMLPPLLLGAFFLFCIPSILSAGVLDGGDDDKVQLTENHIFYQFQSKDDKKFCLGTVKDTEGFRMVPCNSVGGIHLDFIIYRWGDDGVFFLMPRRDNETQCLDVKKNTDSDKTCIYDVILSNCVMNEFNHTQLFWFESIKGEEGFGIIRNVRYDLTKTCTDKGPPALRVFKVGQYSSRKVRLESATVEDKRDFMWKRIRSNCTEPMQRVRGED